MKMCSDIDVKIAGDKPSKDIKRNSDSLEYEKNLSRAEANKARSFGKEVAQKFIADTGISAEIDREDNLEMIIQRRMLLSFAATVGFELFSPNDTLCGIAQKSFLDTLRKQDRSFGYNTDDTGAFSFYYLAFRRGGEIDRRIGQTFAMLCSHDGDPIYQELGEALYCWFLSEVKKSANEFYGENGENDV